MLFEVSTAREAIDKKLGRGRRGTVVFGGSRVEIAVEGERYPLAGSVPPAAEDGDTVVVDDVYPSWSVLRYLAGEYAKGNAHAGNRIEVGDVGVQVLWQIYRDRPPFAYP